MRGKKSILFLLLVLLCLVVVGCGKEKEEEKEEKKISTQTLKCFREEEGTKVTMTVVQDKKSYEFTSVVMDMSSDASMYKDMEIDNDRLKELACSDLDEEYKNCDVKIENDSLTATFEYDLEKFTEQTLKDDNVEKLDENTLSNMKESAEKGGFTCSIS